MGKAITTVGISILYAPIFPLSPLIGLVALLVQYGADQYKTQSFPSGGFNCRELPPSIFATCPNPSLLVSLLRGWD
jgi:hypothetical protein